MTRKCGECTLCCKLLPVGAVQKGANEKCRHQCSNGCKVYRTAAMPGDCWAWNCCWIISADTDDQHRPDRSHYVIDVMPDIVKAKDNKTGEIIALPIVQIWIDPKYPDAIYDPHLRAFASRRAKQGVATMCRFDSRKSVILFEKSDGTWHEHWGEAEGNESTVERYLRHKGILPNDQ